MNEEIINAMNANLATLNKFDYTQFCYTDVPIIQEHIEAVRELCQIYINCANGSIKLDD